MTNRSGTFNVGFYTTRQDVEEKHNMIGLHVNVTKFQILLTTLYKKKSQNQGGSTHQFYCIISMDR